MRNVAMMQPAILCAPAILTIHGIPVGTVSDGATAGTDTLNEFHAGIGLGSAKVTANSRAVIERTQFLVCLEAKITVIRLIVLLQDPKRDITIAVIDIKDTFIRRTKIVSILGIAILILE